MLERYDGIGRLPDWLTLTLATMFELINSMENIFLSNQIFI